MKYQAHANAIEGIDQDGQPITCYATAEAGVYYGVDSQGHENRYVLRGPNLEKTAREIADARKPGADGIGHFNDADTMQLDPNEFGDAPDVYEPRQRERLQRLKDANQLTKERQQGLSDDVRADPQNVTLAVQLAQKHGLDLSDEDDAEKVWELVAKKLAKRRGAVATGGPDAATERAQYADTAAVVQYAEEHNLNLGNDEHYAAAVKAVKEKR